MPITANFRLNEAFAKSRMPPTRPSGGPRGRRGHDGTVGIGRKTEAGGDLGAGGPGDPDRAPLYTGGRSPSAQQFPDPVFAGGAGRAAAPASPGDRRLRRGAGRSDRKPGDAAGQGGPEGG